MYCMHTNPLWNINERHGFNYHMTLKRLDEGLRGIEACLADISTWMDNNLLKLNQTKIELLVVSSKQSAKKTRNFHLNVGTTCIESAKSLRNLGIVLDNTLEVER